jgi:hypothetical protein
MATAGGARIRKTEVWVMALCAGEVSITRQQRIEKKIAPKIGLLRHEAVVKWRKRHAQTAIARIRSVKVVQTYESAMPIVCLVEAWRTHVAERELSAAGRGLLAR